MLTSSQLMTAADEWRERNPLMWKEFKREACERSERHQAWSARGIAESLRWNPLFQRAYGSDFKIPNEITPVLGRMVCDEHPETVRYFRCRKSKVDA